MSSRDRPKRGVGGSSSGGGGGNSNISSSPSRATRSSSNTGSASSSGASRPVRSTRSKTTNHIEYNSDEEDDDIDSKVTVTNNKPRMFKTASTDESMATSSKSSSQKSAASVKVDPDKLAKLESITGLSRAEAMQLLEASGNKLDVAVELHFGGNGPTASTSNGKSTASASTKNNSSGSGGSKRALNSDEPKGASNFVDDNEDGVRAPIPTRSEKLLDYDPYAVSAEPQSKKSRSVFDGFRDLQEEYNESLLDANSSHSKKKQSLASLYRPPLDLLFKGTFEASKAEGCRKNKWLLLNVQNQTDFSCQCLNRDLWRDDTVKEIVRANFIFVQIYFDTAEGKKLIHYYNISTYPFIAILDPRTGEKLTQFNNPTKLDQCLFCEKVTEFLGENELNVSLNGSQEQHTSSSKASTDDIVSVESSSSSSSIVASKEIKPLSNGVAGRAAKQTAKDVIKAMNQETASTSKQNGHHKHDDDLFSADESDDEKPLKPKMTNGIKSIKSTKPTTTAEVKKKEPESKNVVDTIKPSVILPLSSRFETTDNNTKDCTVRILYPGGERLDFCTNGNNKFNLLVSYLSEQGFTSRTHHLIERMMPVYSAPTPVQASPSQESTKAISSEMSNLMITNQSRNLLCHDDSSQTFKELNLFPRVLLLLQEI